MAWTLPCPQSYANRSTEELARLTHLRISCGPCASDKSSAPGRQLDALVRCPTDARRGLSPHSPGGSGEAPPRRTFRPATAEESTKRC